MSRPLIAIGGRRLRAGKVAGWPGAAVAAPDAYADGIRRAGGRPAVVLPEPLDDAEARRLLERFDAVVLMGGGDIDPARYDEPRRERIYGVDAERDAFEIAVARAAAET
ncbi:MAG TPA: gamma-glutamyl-gamma-aminobutyrate hydrolase family protein, partial [Actinomycetota bacterium]|nr:gamma-glutamyl-gamma-aminobutyrate hydrolase family protein [Actinomycetota bacterium]